MKILAFAKCLWASNASLHMVMRKGNKVGGLLHMLKLAPEIIENWLRRACNQAETSSRALSFIFSSKVTTQFQAYARCLKEQLQVGRNRFANWFRRSSYSWLGRGGCFVLLVFGLFGGFLHKLKSRGGNKCGFFRKGLVSVIF